MAHTQVKVYFSMAVTTMRHLRHLPLHAISDYVIKSHIEEESGVGIGMLCAACPFPLPPLLFKCPSYGPVCVW